MQRGLYARHWHCCDVKPATSQQLEISSIQPVLLSYKSISRSLIGCCNITQIDRELEMVNTYGEQVLRQISVAVSRYDSK